MLETVRTLANRAQQGCLSKLEELFCCKYVVGCSMGDDWETHHPRAEGAGPTGSIMRLDCESRKMTDAITSSADAVVDMTGMQPFALKGSTDSKALILGLVRGQSRSMRLLRNYGKVNFAFSAHLPVMVSHCRGADQLSVMFMNPLAHMLDWNVSDRTSFF